ncbi:MAG: ParB/RepB/Spo0J family partition protein [Eubacteriales bacterium]
MNKNRKGLGKGLSALIPDTEDITHENVMEIDVQEIKPNDAQPRRMFDEDKLDELAQSITVHGVIQPLIVIKITNGYQIVAGERRWRAALKVGLKKIPVVVKKFTDQEIMEIALIENLQREDLSDIETALAYKELMKRYGITQAEMAKQLGKSRVSVTNTLRLLQLPLEVQQYIQDNKISAGHARAILSAPDSLKKSFAKKIIEQNLSVREAEKYVSKMKDTEIQKEEISKKRVGFQEDLLKEIEEELQKMLGTKVFIKHNNAKGKIEINYYSNDDLDRIVNILRDNVSRET